MLNHLLRYEPVVGILERLPASSLLEVGSGSRGVGRYLRRPMRVTACDVDFGDYGSQAVGSGARTRRVVGSVLDLPFATASFDVVVALDLLEHLAPADRSRAVSELVRVGGAVIVGCPTGSGALAGDRRLASYLRRLGRSSPGWLDEHLENGFPAPGELVGWLGGADVVIPNLSIKSHLAVCGLEATPLLSRLPLALEAGLRPLMRRPGARRLVRCLSGSDRGLTYRTIAVRYG